MVVLYQRHLSPVTSTSLDATTMVELVSPEMVGWCELGWSEEMDKKNEQVCQQEESKVGGIRRAALVL